MPIAGGRIRNIDSGLPGAVLIGALDPFPIWLGYAVLAVAAATMLAWRWLALASGKGSHPSLVITSCVLLMVLVMAGVAVT